MMYKSDDIRKIIRDVLLPIVGKKCALFNLPYHDNIGDVLIWEGEEAFFKDNDIECVGHFSIYSFDQFQFGPEVTICIHGGGHIGDTWRGFQLEINKIVQSYPNNRIVIFPQSVYYKDIKCAQFDSELFGTHHDLFICARDRMSFDFLRRFFKNTILLVPDMALYIGQKKEEEQSGKKLFLKRSDKEAVDLFKFSMDGLEIHDWPTVEYVYTAKSRVLITKGDRIRRKLLRIGMKLAPRIPIFCFLERRVIESLQSGNYDIGTKWRICYDEMNYLFYLNRFKLNGRLNRVIDWFANTCFRPITVSYGIDFINQYDVVYTTRLHGGILSMILGKTCYFVDNSNHKISSFYNTWSEYLGDDVFMV